MAAHLPTSERAQRGAALLVALGIGLVTLAITDNDDGEQALPGTTTTSAPQVLGAVVTAPPAASPAEPVPVEVPDTATTEPGGSAVTVRTRATSPVPRAATSTTALVTTSTTSPSTDPTLIPPTYIENTTTTTDATTTTTDGTTTTETTAVP